MINHVDMTSSVSLGINLGLWAKPASAWTVSANKDELAEETAKIEKKAEEHITALSTKLKRMASKNHQDSAKEIEALQEQAIRIVRKVLSSCSTCDNPVMLDLENIYSYLSENAFKWLGVDAFDMLFSMFKEANSMLETNIPDVRGGFDIEGDSRKKWNQYSEKVMVCTNNLIIAEDYERDTETSIIALADRFKKAAFNRADGLREQLLAMSDWLRTDSVRQVRMLFIKYPDRLNFQKSCASLYQYVLAEFGNKMSDEDCIAYLKRYSSNIERYWDMMRADMELEFQQKSGIRLCSLAEATESEKQTFDFGAEESKIWETNFIRYDPRRIIPIVEAALRRYPEVLRTKFPKRILFDFRNNFRSGSVATGETKAFLINPEQVDISDHELFHWFDDISFGDAFKLSDSLWCSITKSVYEGKWSWLERERPGFARGYGLTNSSEDRATVAEMIFRGNFEQLKLRLTNDPVLLMKVEILTSCHFDSAQGRFVKLYTRDELRECYGLSDYLYYARWSSVNGRVMMDVDYWNNILAQNRNKN